MARVNKLPLKELVLEGAGFTNPRIQPDKKHVKEIAEDIAARGEIITPLLIWKAKVDDSYLNVILAGGTRYHAVELLDNEKRCPKGLKNAIPVKFVDLGSTDLRGARAIAHVDNAKRKGNTSYERAVSIKWFADDGMQQKEIAELLALSASVVSRALRSLEKTTEFVQRSWKMGRITEDIVQDLSKLSDVEQNAKLQEILDHLDKGTKGNGETTREAKSAARQAVKGAKNGASNGANGASDEVKPKRPSNDKIGHYIEMTGKAPKKNRYVRGMHDALRFMAGDLGAGEFDKEFLEFAQKAGYYKTDAAPTKKAAKKARA